MNKVEQLVARRQIDKLIRDDPFDLVLLRKPRISQPGGGWRFGDPVPLPPQQVLIAPFKRRLSEYMVNTEQGTVADLPYVVLGRHDLDIQRFDEFDYEGQRMKVESLDLKKYIRILAQADYVGASNA